MLEKYKIRLFKYLQTAIELEHSTIPPYLCGMFTINEDNNPDSYFLIRSVVMEEMLHMTLACNVLNAVGGSPVIDKPEFIPEYPVKLDFKMRDFEVALEKFSPSMIETALKIEEPADDVQLPVKVMSALEGIRHEASARLAQPDLEVQEGDSEIDIPALTIGEFYEMVIQMLRVLCEVFGEENVFNGDPGLQINSKHYYGSGGTIIEVIDLATAIAALQLIVDQGEGAPMPNLKAGKMHYADRSELGHYYKFNEIKHGHYYQPGDDPNVPTGKILPVNYAAALPMYPNPKEDDFAEGSELRSRARQFNVIYSGLLHHLHCAFNGKQELLRQAIITMYELRYSAVALLNVPMPDKPRQNAGPPFQYVGPAERGAVFSNTEA